MARARNIKPGFFVNDDLADCPPLARLMFIGLWTLADAEGRLKDKPNQIKAQTLPYDDCDPDALLISLEQSGFIQRYTGLGQPTIQVVNFDIHQNPHINEKKKGSKFVRYEDRDKEVEENQRLKEKSRIIEINPDKYDTNRDESLLLNPDSLNPLTESGSMKEETLMSSKLDAAKNILEFLNRKTGKGFKPVDSNLKLIKARLNEGHAEHEVLSVIERKCKEWADDDKMSQYLRPATLFGAEKFNQYVGELGVETPEERRNRELDEWANGKTIEGQIVNE